MPKKTYQFTCIKSGKPAGLALPLVHITKGTIVRTDNGAALCELNADKERWKANGEYKAPSPPPIAIKEHKPSKKALIAAARLARKMYREDTWIRPSIEDNDLEEAGDDYGQFTLVHREGWEQTNQCQQWINQLTDLSEAEAERLGIPRIDNWERWFYSIHCPMKDAFWDAWEEKAKLYQAWETARKAEG